MLKGLLNIIVKEVKEMVRDPKILLGMIIVPLLMFPLMGFAIQTSMETAQQSIQETSIALIDQDHGTVATALENYLLAFNTVTHLDDVPIDQALVEVQDSNATSLVIIPEGFSQNITDGGTATLTIYTPWSGSGGIASSVGSAATTSLLSSFETALVDQRINQGFPDANATEILNPIQLSEKSIVKGKSADVSPDILFGLMMSQSVAMPVGIMSLLIFAMQLALPLLHQERGENS